MEHLRLNTYQNDPQTIKEIGENKRNLLNCFETAIFVEEIPNEYTLNQIEPWYQVTTHKGRVKVGWRKRVIVLDWEGSNIEGDAEFYFPDENVTKVGKMIHAWGYDKLKEYLKTIFI